MVDGSPFVVIIFINWGNNMLRRISDEIEILGYFDGP